MEEIVIGISLNPAAVGSESPLVLADVVIGTSICPLESALEAKGSVLVIGVEIDFSLGGMEAGMAGLVGGASEEA